MTASKLPPCDGNKPNSAARSGEQPSIGKGIRRTAFDYPVALAAAFHLLLAISSMDAHGQELTIYEDSDTQTKGSEHVGVLGPSFFGDSTDFNSGATTFLVTDVSLPGNSDLPVALQRSLRAFDDGIEPPQTLFFPKWTNFEVAYLSGLYKSTPTYNGDTGWRSAYLNGSSLDRCSLTNGAPTVTQSGGKEDEWEKHEYWHGNHLFLPGSGQEVMRTIASADPSNPTDGKTYHWATSSNWRFSCLPTTKNGAGGEGFLGIAPDGTKYWFDWLVKWRNAPLLEKEAWTGGPTQLERAEYRLLVTRIEDRHGNWVTYSYSGNNLTKITANDGRTLTLLYDVTGQRLASVSDGTRTWTYSYTNGVEVTFPDSTTWHSTVSGPGVGRSRLQTCDDDRLMYNGSLTVTIEARTGAIGQFVFQPARRGISYMYWPLAHDCPASRAYIDNISLSLKTISGPGLTSSSWTISHGPHNGCYAGRTLNGCGSGAPTSRRVDVNGPAQTFTRFHFGNKYHDNEGALLRIQTGTSISDVIRDETLTWETFSGHGFASGGGYLGSIIRREKTRSISQEGVTYTTEYSHYDAYLYVGRTIESNSFSNNVRYTRQTYVHDTSLWVLGLPAETLVSDNDDIFAVTDTYSTGWEAFSARRTSYFSATDPEKRLPKYHSAYGLWFKRNVSYHTSGDQAGLPKIVRHNPPFHFIEYSDYKSGIPQTIRTPESLGTASQYAYRVVDDNGWVTQETDFLGQCTNYDYDDMGRLTLIDPCDPRWLSTTISYAPTASNEGLSHVVAGMRKQTVTTGDYQKITYFDALLRPRLVKAWDQSATATERYTRSDFDAYGHLTFRSLPHTDSSTPYGVLNQYDVLGRLKVADDNTTLGAIEFTYLSNNRVQTNDNKGNVTTTAYLAYGTPEQALPTSIVQPHSVTTTLHYNVQGHLSSASQGGITESRVYDAYRKLCKIVRPDVGNTAYGYNVRGMLIWQASGSSVSGSTSACDAEVTASARIDYGYDNLGKLYTVTFGDSSPDKIYIYDKNGRLTQLTAGLVTTAYDYNSKDLIELETLSVDGQTFSLDYGYNSTGHLTTTLYPSGASIAHAPNALGQATRAAAYATGAAYHPNSMIKSHSYGNGFVHTSALKTSGLPDTFYDLRSGTYALNHGFSYDANNNLTLWDDKVNSAYDVQATYDGLDRLDAIPDSYLGAGDVNYDTMGNITYYKLGTQAITYLYNAAKRLGQTTGSQAYTFAYDDRGNVTNNGRHIFTYNAANQMVSAGSYSYVYDGNNKRVMQTDSHGTSYSFYGSNGKLMYRKEGGTHVDYYYLGGKLVAKKKGSTVTYLHSDYLGSPAAESSTTGAVTARLHYQPFGDPIDASRDDVGYTGHKFDTDLGLNYMEARYYDPVLGRFMANDPVGFSPSSPMSFSRYLYANNNPYAYIDPTGMDPYLVSRPLGFTDAANHNFIVTGADYPGDPNAEVRSFGDRGDDTMGEVTDVTEGFSAGTHEADRQAWESLSGEASPVTFREIDATDAEVEHLTDSMVPGQEYSAIPELQGGVNSNTAAGAIAQEADGGEPEVDNGIDQPGTAPYVIDNIRFRAIPEETRRDY